MGSYNKRGQRIVVGRDCVKMSPRDCEDCFQSLTSPIAFPGQGALSAMTLADLPLLIYTSGDREFSTSPCGCLILMARKDFLILTQISFPWTLYPLVLVLPIDAPENAFVPSLVGQPFRYLETIQLS